MHFGIDYGSKVAGTTGVCYMADEELVIQCAKKGQDADRWIKDLSDEMKPESIFIDAPLSLPGTYYGPGSDFFYRHADRELGAMSPMFLGGLTARAMKLKSELDIPMIEVYPSGLIKALFLSSYYNKKTGDLQVFIEKLCEKISLPRLNRSPVNWHEVDAVLAWVSGARYVDGKAMAYGRPDEGQIFV